MFCQLEHDIVESYHEHKKIILDKAINYEIIKKGEVEDINKILIEKGYKKYSINPLIYDDLHYLSIILAVIEQSEKYYQLGYKYPCFECSL